MDPIFRTMDLGVSYHDLTKIIASEQFKTDPNPDVETKVGVWFAAASTAGEIAKIYADWTSLICEADIETGIASTCDEPSTELTEKADLAIHYGFLATEHTKALVDLAMTCTCDLRIKKRIVDIANRAVHSGIDLLEVIHQVTLDSNNWEMEETIRSASHGLHQYL